MLARVTKIPKLRRSIAACLTFFGLVLSGLVLSGFGGAWIALGQDQPPNQQAGAVAQACAADVHALCAGVQPGEGRIKQCLVQNRQKISTTCKQALRDARAARSQANGS